MLFNGISLKKKNSVFQKGFIKKAYVVIACLLMLYLHIFSQEESFVASMLIVFGLFLGIEVSISVYLSSFIIQVEFSDFQTKLLLVYMTVILLYAIIRNGIIKRAHPYSVLIILFWLITLFSTLAGYKTSLISNLIFLSQMLMMIAVLYYSKENLSLDLFIYGIVFAGICVGLYVFYLYLSDSAVYMVMSITYGEGENAGEVKQLATSIAIPAFYSIYFLIYNKAGYLKKAFLAIAFIACIVVITLTYSRGVLLAIALSILLMLFYYYKEKFNLWRVLGLLVAVSCLVFGYISLDIDNEYMIANMEGGHGRTQIWGYFISKLQEGGISQLLFGFGTGDSKRITEGSAFSGYYSHSVILDYLFAYGVIGLTFILYLIGKTAFNLYKKRYVIYLCLLVLICVMFFSHGSSYNLLFHFILAICLGKSLPNSFYNGKCAGIQQRIRQRH